MPGIRGRPRPHPGLPMTFRLNGSTCAASALAALLSAMAFPSAQETVTPPPKFTVPAGFEVVRVAGPPLVDRPIVADFDERGRLYVADSSGLQRQGRKATRRSAAPDRAARRQGRRRDVRHQRGLRRPHDAAAGRDVVRRLAVRGSAAQHLEADRHQRRRRRRHARRMVRRQDADGLRQRSARAVSRTRRVDLLDQGRVCRADLRAAGQAAAGDARRAHLPPAAWRDARGAGDHRRHGQPGRRRVHAQRRGDAHGNLPRASAARPARRVHSRRLRRPVRQAARRHRRTPANRRPDAAGQSPRGRRRLGPDPLRVARRSATAIATTSSRRCSTCRR